MNEEFRKAYTNMKTVSRHAKMKIDSVLDAKDKFRNLPGNLGIEEMENYSRYFQAFIEGIEKYLGDIE